jgi:glutathione synthase/RimK-type ligase-like ATP-grasp enzyme
MILIVAEAIDPHVRMVAKRLEEKGAAVVRLDVGELPADCTLSVFAGDGAVRVRGRRALGDFDLSAVRSIWLRRTSDARADARLEGEDRAFVERETTALLVGLAGALGERFWVNPLANALVARAGNGKIAHLELARRAGLAVPRTLATNDPDAAREFVRGCPGGAIFKPFAAPVRTEELADGRKRYRAVYTTKLDDAALAKLDSVRLGPGIFQELVPKRLELRVTVIGERVFATEIHSQVHDKSAVDFRRHYDLGSTPYLAHELPERVRDRLLALLRALGLVFGACDLILRPDGEYVFLEVNEQGQFLWLEEQTGQPLLENFCELLIQATPRYLCDAPMHEPGLPPLP